MSSIPIRRRLEYARGYIELGMIEEAAAELDAIVGDARLSTEVLRVRMDLYMEAKKWEMVVSAARPVCAATPDDPEAWIHWAFALHELKRTQEAQDVLLRAEPLHGTKNSVLHYNLACYACVLGDRTEARRRLKIACKMDQQWQTAALDDPDLKALWNDNQATT